jgi:hypothetical protein
MKKISELSPDEQRLLLQFNFRGGPIDDPEKAESAFTAFGLAAMSWARLETHLDALLIHLNKKRFSKEIFDPKHPVSFSRKLRLLKQWFGGHKALSHLKPQIDKLATQLRTLSEARNAFLHTLFSAYDEEKDEITLKSLYYAGRDEFHIQRRDVGTAKLIRFAVTVNSVNQSLSVITSALFTADAVELLQSP